MRWYKLCELGSLARTYACEDILTCSTTKTHLSRRPAGLLELHYEVVPEVLGDLLVEPAAGVVLRDVEPDEPAAHEVVPTHLAVVGCAVTLGHLIALWP